MLEINGKSNAMMFFDEVLSWFEMPRTVILNVYEEFKTS